MFKILWCCAVSWHLACYELYNWRSVASHGLMVWLAYERILFFYY